MKRIAIYVYHDKNGIIAEYALFFLKSLLEISDEIVMVINGKVNPNELNKIQSGRIQIIERENTGYDFWAYRAGFLSIGSEKIQNYDELIFANSSMFGPVYPFQEMFRKMSSSDADFWGITKHPAIKQNVIKFNPKTKIKEHLQSYFLVFRQKMFLSHNFRKYFENLRKIKSKREAIAYLEVSFTEHFKKLGYRSDAFVDDSILDYGVDNYCQYLPDILVKDYKVPLIKKTIFGERFDLAQRESYGNKTAKLFSFIKESTKYDTSLITQEITRCYSMSLIKKFLHLNFVLQTSCRESFLKGRCACILEGMGTYFPYIEQYFKKYLGLIDLFSTTPVKKPGLKITPLNSAVGMFSQIKKLTEKYDYFLIFLPDFNLLKKEKPVVIKDYLGHLLNCMVSARIYLSNIASVFDKNPEIGILTPIPFVFNGFDFPKNIITKEDLEDFLEKADIDIIADYKFLNTIPSCFWMSKKLVEKIEDNIDFETNTALNLGMIFSIYAQKYGFLTATVSPPDIMAEYIDALEYMHLQTDRK